MFGLVFCTPMVTSQTSGFSQQGKVTHDLQEEGLSIAHPSLPLNSKAKIVNTSTGKEVEVTITRLIPASQKRIADVSSGVWKELGLTPDTEIRIYTTASARSQTTSSPAAGGSQTTAAQTAASSEPSPTAGGSQTTAARTAQADTSSSSVPNMPANVKFENNFIINGSPAGQPSVSYETRPQSAERGGQTSVTHQTSPQYQPPSVTYNAPQAKPSVSYETRPQQTQSVAKVENGSQSYQPNVEIINWTQTKEPVVAYETKQQQAPVHNAEKPLPQEDKNPSFTEIVSPMSRTLVYIDAPPNSPRHSVTIDNDAQLYRIEGGGTR